MSPIYTQNLRKKTVGPFLKMYQAPYFPFTSLSKTAYDLDLLSVTAVTGKQYLKTNGISEKFGHDIIQASTRVNYAQNLDQIHGLETMVCMATDGAMSIEGGNWQIFDGMIQASGATLLLNTSVSAIAKDASSGKYSIKTTSAQPLHPPQDRPSSSYDEEWIYDTIVLASPLQFSNITFTPPLSSHPPAIPYVSLHVTLFTSARRLSPSYFNLPPSSLETMPTTILTTTLPPSSNSSLPFFSISTLALLDPPLKPDPEIDLECGTTFPEYLYKIFSPAPLSRAAINEMLDREDLEKELDWDVIKWIYEKRWDSYPYLPPKVDFDDIKLDWPSPSPSPLFNGVEDRKWDGAGVWYTSGIESFISTMETSSLMGMNIARLIHDGWENEALRTMVAKDGLLSGEKGEDGWVVV